MYPIILKLPKEVFFHINSYLIGEKTLYFYDIDILNEYLKKFKYENILENIKIIDKKYLSKYQENKKIKNNVFNLLKVNKLIRNLTFEYLNIYKIFWCLSYKPKWEDYNVKTYDFKPILNDFSEKKIVSFLEFYENLKDSVWKLSITDLILRRIQDYQIVMNNIKFLEIDIYDDLYYEKLSHRSFYKSDFYEIDYNDKLYKYLEDKKNSDNIYFEEDNYFDPFENRKLSDYFDDLNRYENFSHKIYKEKEKEIEIEIFKKYKLFMNDLIKVKMLKKNISEDLLNKFEKKDEEFALKNRKYYKIFSKKSELFELKDEYYYDIFKRDFLKKRKKIIHFPNLKLVYGVNYFNTTINLKNNIIDIIGLNKNIVYHFFEPFNFDIKNLDKMENFNNLYFEMDNELNDSFYELKNEIHYLNNKIKNKDNIYFDDSDKLLENIENFSKIKCLSNELIIIYDNIFKKNKKKLKKKSLFDDFYDFDENYEIEKNNFPLYISYLYRCLNHRKTHVMFNIFDINNENVFSVEKYKKDFEILYKMFEYIKEYEYF